MRKRFRGLRRGGERGFTLVELLVVITVLGVLAAIVVFSVGGFTDRGQDSACEIDLNTLRTAQEAYFAKNLEYAADEDDLTETPNRFLSKESIWYDTTGTATEATYARQPAPPGETNPCPVPT